MRLLLVEDNLDNANLIIRTLQAAGYDVTHKVYGLEGMAEARRTAFDCILLDFDLPDIDGSQVGLSLRKMYPAKPIIALTAHADSVSRSKARLFGFTAFISKPFTDTDLIGAIEAVTRPAISN
jgi:DNA-binding response OmpR family regulator